MSNTYFTFQALVSQRASGYRNTTYAIAELIDNAFDAVAQTCRVIFIEKRDFAGKKFIDEILICDDGLGMTDETLRLCLKFGGGTNFDIEQVVEKKKIGKFGFGLPNASLSQCPNVRVITWTGNGPPKQTRLVLEELRDAESIEIPDIETVDLPPLYEKVGARISKKSGTIVSWRNCDRLSNTRAETIMRKSEEILGQIYRHLIDDGHTIEVLNFEVSDQQQAIPVDNFNVRRNDPIFLMEDTVIAGVLHSEANKISALPPENNPANYYKNFSKGPTKCLATNVIVDDHSGAFNFAWKGQVYKFEITTSRVHDDIQKPGIREGGDTPVGKFYKKHEKECISFVRAGREIAASNFGFNISPDARNRWWSIEVKFGPESDDLLGVHNNKQSIEFVYTDEDDPTVMFDENVATLQQAREQLWFRLSNQLQCARKAAWKKILEGGKRPLPGSGSDGGGNGGSPLPGATGVTTGITIGVDGKRKGQFTEDDKKLLFKRLKERFPEIPDEEIWRAIELYDKALLRACVLYAPSESEKLWSITNIQSFLIILINTNHKFYENVMQPIRDSEKERALAALELFISSLGWEEFEHFNSEPKDQIIESYRTYVGIHLNQYLQDFDLTDLDSFDE